MNSKVRLALHPTNEQSARLARLQARFAEACNALAVVVQQSRCWNRVALHHMTYRMLRDRFTDLGSQMACNAIYSVSRSARLVHQHTDSPYHIARMAGRPLPQMEFSTQSPVFFDRHTLSLRSHQVSMYTLDGRMRFELSLSPDNERRFREDRLKEIVLASNVDGYSLTFLFEEDSNLLPSAVGVPWPDHLDVKAVPAMTAHQPPTGAPMTPAA